VYAEKDFPVRRVPALLVDRAHGILHAMLLDNGPAPVAKRRGFKPHPPSCLCTRGMSLEACRVLRIANYRRECRHGFILRSLELYESNYLFVGTTGKCSIDSMGNLLLRLFL
jgi:hypothetical protein